MWNKNTLILSLILLSITLISFRKFSIISNKKLVEIEYPKEWPKPVYDFKNNPLDSSKIELGRKLFYDPILSLNNTISCGSCHLSFTAFTHVDHELSHGINDSIGTRNSPVLINLAWNKHFMWDGGVNHIDAQALAPITNPVEMAETITGVVDKLQKSEKYPKLFLEAFGDSIVTGEHLLKAIAQFQLTLVSANSKYDKVKKGETIFTSQEKNGYKLFKQHCNSCHTEPLFTNGGFANNGLCIDTTLNDYGRINITQNSEDSLKFKIPTLRNIEFSFPYMHDGRFKKISDVLDHYSNGISNSKTLDPELIKKLILTSNEKVDLTAFLLTLTDKEFLFNPKFSFPRN